MSDIPIKTLFITELYLCKINMFILLFHQSQNSASRSQNIQGTSQVEFGYFELISGTEVSTMLGSTFLPITGCFIPQKPFERNRDRTNVPTRGARGAELCSGHSSRNLLGIPMGKGDLPDLLPASKGVPASAQGVISTSPSFFPFFWLGKREKIANIAAMRQLSLE